MRVLVGYPFAVNAFEASGAVAVAAGVVGWFVVLRREAFAAHTLALVGFPGAAGAVLIGVAPSAGFYAFGAGAALVLGAAPRGRREGAAVGTVQALALGLGLWFAVLWHGNVASIESLLFGTVVGVDAGSVRVLVATALLSLSSLALFGRRLWWASADPEGAAARGIGVRRLGAVFLLILGLVCGEAAQIVGALLVFALVVPPPAAAHALTPRPGRSIATAVGLALAAAWGGVALALLTDLPVGFCVTALAVGEWGGARAWQAASVRQDRLLYLRGRKR